MSGAEELLPEAVPPWPGETAATARRPRRGLFRKYVLALVGLVAAALAVNAGIESWFSYRESKAALLGLQQEKADAAAQQIGEFVQEIEKQIGWTTLPLWGTAPLEQRRFDFVRLIRQVPAITELSELDGAGREQLRVSRIAMDVVGSGVDFSHKPEFTEARAHGTWFGPVYFRKQSEPYMTLAMADAGHNAGVTVAEINLKLIWDVVTRLKVGRGGYAYVVDRHGKLIADPDISRVLRDTDLSKLPQVAAALAAMAGRRAAAPLVTVAENKSGGSVLSAHAVIAPLHWVVFVEVPLQEAFAPLYRSALRGGFWLVLALLGAALAGLYLARRMTGPIHALQAGAAQIGAGELDSRIAIRSGDELESLADQFNDMAGRLQASYADLEQKVADRTAELSESLEQQTATAEVLGVVSSSPSELAPVFEVMLETAARLCSAEGSRLFLCRGDGVRVAAQHGEFTTQLGDEGRPFVPHPETALAQALKSRKPAKIDDATAYFGKAMALGEEAIQRPSVAEGWRSLFVVPMVREGELVGAIATYRRDARPFEAKHISLVENFAAQAVIAMENARLITETREALEQQTATAEVLGVINSSPGDLAPVFDAVLDNAMRLCEAASGSLASFDREEFYWHNVRGVPQSYAAGALGRTRATPGSALDRIIEGERLVHIEDVTADEAYLSGNPQRRNFADGTGARTALWIALRKENALRGVLLFYRREVRPFSDKQIALLQNFAAQAVIAMENARLITETQEALEQQTATAEVLGVINASPGDLAPVFDAILEKAHTLCGADHGHLTIYDGQHFRSVAQHGVPEGFAEMLRQPFRPGHHFGERLLAGEPLIHIPDMAALTSSPEDPIAGATVDVGRIRTLLFLPLRKENRLLGYITAHREEVRPFSEKQVALLQNFAAQAVIAMENARLITETQEALEQQTATAEVLGVINASPGDLAPVFDAMLDKAMHLCSAAFGILLTYDGARFHHSALHSIPAEYAEFMRVHPPVYGPASAPGRLAAGEGPVHIADMRDTDAYRAGDQNRRAIADLAGARTLVAVPLRKDGGLLGAIVVFRQEVRPFTDKQIALLENFSAQAVIAMENARLLTETRRSQAELATTFDNMGDGVAMFDADLRLAAWNRNFQQMLDLPDALLAGRPSSSGFVRYLATRGEFGAVDVEAEVHRLADDIGTQWSAERTRPDGRTIEVRHNPVPEGGFVLIYSDVTERKRAEEEIRAARDAAENALAELRQTQQQLVVQQKMAALGQLTAGIAHEIKNPLNFVNNFAGLSIELLGELKETAGPAIETLDAGSRTEIDETFELLTSNMDKIAEHGQRADNIVKSMLAHSRGSSGERQAVDLNALVDEALNLAYHGARAQDQNFNITMEREFDPNLAPIEVVPQDVTRVFLNLIGNGFHAANKRREEAGDGAFRPLIKITTRDLGSTVEVSVRDNGTGIAREHRERLFQPFFTTKPTGEGTGLGLSISYDIVTQQHGGSITVDTEEGKFTEFTVRLPRPQPGRAAGKAA